MGKPSHNAKDHTGKRYARLLVLKYSGIKETVSSTTGKKHRERIWICVCDCGNHIEVRGSALSGNHTQSCGCLHADAVNEFNKTKRHAPGDSAKRQEYGHYRNAAKTRKRSFDLSFEEFVILSELPCHYCGQVASCEAKVGSYSKWAKNGIDRLDNNLGYTLANSVPCCKTCNRMKSTFGYFEFILSSLRIAQYLFSNGPNA